MLPTESKFNPEPTDKAQVMLRLANGDKVKTIREQEAAMIDKCVDRKDGKYAITIVLYGIFKATHARKGRSRKSGKDPLASPKDVHVYQAAFRRPTSLEPSFVVEYGVV